MQAASQQVQALNRLKISAQKTATMRGHRLGLWILESDHQANAACLRCYRDVTVSAKPAPNGIGISGTAVALNCEVAQ